MSANRYSRINAPSVVVNFPAIRGTVLVDHAMAFSNISQASSGQRLAYALVRGVGIGMVIEHIKLIPIASLTNEAFRLCATAPISRLRSTMIPNACVPGRQASIFSAVFVTRRAILHSGVRISIVIFKDKDGADVRHVLWALPRKNALGQRQGIRSKPE